MFKEEEFFEEPGVTIAVERKFPDGECQTITIATNKWDADGEEMGQLLRKLLAALGFSEHTINEVFGDDCDCYRELVPLKVDYVEIAPTPEGETLADVLAKEDPCYGCDVDCDSTACLEEQKQFDSWGSGPREV
jgi:hypothetical protein